MFWPGGHSSNILVMLEVQSFLVIGLKVLSRSLVVLETRSTTWSFVLLLYTRSMRLWFSIGPVPSSQSVDLGASSQKSRMPFFITSWSTQNGKVLPSHCKVLDGAGTVLVRDKDVVWDAWVEVMLGGLLGGIPLSSPGGAVASVPPVVDDDDDSVWDIGVKLILVELLDEIALSPTVDDDDLLLSVLADEAGLLAAVDSVVGGGAVVGPTFPLLPDTVIEAKLIVSDWKIAGGV